MNCIYNETFEETTQEEIISAIKTMFASVATGKAHDYARATFSRRYSDIVLEVLPWFKFILQHDQNMSCELHIVNDKIHLEFMRQ